jgi:hypothetical protein
MLAIQLADLTIARHRRNSEHESHDRGEYRHSNHQSQEIHENLLSPLSRSRNYSGFTGSFLTAIK